jgi:hypothetical protein
LSNRKDNKDKDQKKHDQNEKECVSVSCICEALLEILDKQDDHKNNCEDLCSFPDFHKSTHETIPFILQTPYGHPYFTWGKIGTDECFVTVFVKVIKVDCEQNCAVLQLLKPNISIIDPDTNCVETENICDVDFLIPTKECVLVDLCHYTAIKLVSPDLVKNKC